MSRWWMFGTNRCYQCKHFKNNSPLEESECWARKSKITKSGYAIANWEDKACGMFGKVEREVKIEKEKTE